jgi:hypothetical protein
MRRSLGSQVHIIGEGTHLYHIPCHVEEPCLRRGSVGLVETTRRSQHAPSRSLPREGDLTWGDLPEASIQNHVVEGVGALHSLHIFPSSLLDQQEPSEIYDGGKRG